MLATSSTPLADLEMAAELLLIAILAGALSIVGAGFKKKDQRPSVNVPGTISYPFTSRTYVSLSIARGIAAGPWTY